MVNEENEEFVNRPRRRPDLRGGVAGVTPTGRGNTRYGAFRGDTPTGYCGPARARVTAAVAAQAAGRSAVAQADESRQRVPDAFGFVRERRAAGKLDGNDAQVVDDDEPLPPITTE